MCSSLVPHFVHDPTQITSKGNWTGSRLRPCRSFCYAVEQRCPYLLPTPGLSTQYAGEPTFLCGGKQKDLIIKKKKKKKFLHPFLLYNMYINFARSLRCNSDFNIISEHSMLVSYNDGQKYFILCYLQCL